MVTTDAIAGKRAPQEHRNCGRLEAQVGKSGAGQCKHLTATANLSRQLSRYHSQLIYLDQLTPQHPWTTRATDDSRPISKPSIPSHHVVKSCPPGSASCCRSVPVCCVVLPKKTDAFPFYRSGACSSVNVWCFGATDPPAIAFQLYFPLRGRN